ncbi:MAG TPA: glycosyltransferase 87 family protein, partial [Ktedonobacterales bacterium]
MPRTSEPARAGTDAPAPVPPSASRFTPRSAGGAKPVSPSWPWVPSRVSSWFQGWLRAWGKRGWWSPLVEVVLLALGVVAARSLINLTIYGAGVINHDVREYQIYATQFWTVAPLFHHLPVEYPPLSILPFTLTLLPSLADPTIMFTVWMGVLFIAGYFWMARYAGRRRAAVYAVYLLVGAASTVFGRYDLVPALVTLLALHAAARHRFTWAHVLLALGILLKLYPAFLVPLVAIEQWRTLARAPQTSEPAWAADGRSPNAPTTARLARWLGALDRAALWAVARGVGLCVLVVDLGFANAALLSPRGALSGFSYAGARPLQIESTPASLLWVGSWFGFPAHAVYTFQSLNLVGPLDRWLAPLSALALAGGCLFVYWRQLRGRLDVGHAFVACLCVVLVTNKIFSPQYLIWVLPLVAYVVGFDALWLLVCLLTTAIYPFLYFAHPHILLVARDVRFLPLITLRNALLLVVTVRALSSRAPGVRRWPLARGLGRLR